MDEIRIEDLEIYAYHGVYPFETQKGQPFYVNATLYTDTRKAGLTDELNDSTNYGELCHFITDWMVNHTSKLIESVCEGLTEAILLKFDLIQKVTLEVRKPKAPIGLPFSSVSVKITRGWHDVYLSVGSNMGEKEAYITKGVEALKADVRIANVKESALLVTKPYGGVEQDDFVNGVIYLRTLYTPEELLDKLHEIEAHADRKRELRWGPRTLDMDIVFYDKLVYESDDLIIPHVDMQNRYFVLKPLSELAPNYRHPILGKTVTELLNACEEE